MAPQNITLTLPLDDVNVILAALSELPLKASVAVWSKIVSQAEPQIKKEETVVIGGKKGSK